MKLHEMMISGIFVTVVFIGFMIYYANGAVEYEVNGQDYRNTTHINSSLHDITEKAERTKNAMNAISGLPFGLDIVGGVLVGGYGAVQIAGESVEVLENVVGDATSYLPIGEFGDTVFIFAGSALLIIIFIAILAHFISKSERV